MRSTHTTFTQLVGCAVPIQQGPIGFASAEPALPAAVAAAGGHGMLAAIGMPAAALADRLDGLNAQTRCYGVNFIQPLAAADAVDVAAERAPLVEFFAGPVDPDLVARARRHGALTCYQVISAEDARAAEAAGCDLVVARGIEARGRTYGGIGLLPLLDAVLDAVHIPVLAAGGIATARAVAAVLAAGAAGARVGTRFLVADEAATHPVYAQAVLDAGDDDTVLTDAFSAGAPVTPHRVLRSCLRAAEAFDGAVVAEMDVYGERIAIPRFGHHNPARTTRGRVEAMALYVGQGAGAIRQRQPAAAIVADLAGGAGSRPRPSASASQAAGG